MKAREGRSKVEDLPELQREYRTCLGNQVRPHIQAKVKREVGPIVVECLLNLGSIPSTGLPMPPPQKKTKQSEHTHTEVELQTRIPE